MRRIPAKGREGGTVCEYCFVGEALVRLVADGPGAKKALLYYDTNFLGWLVPLHSRVAGRTLSVWCVTETIGHLR